MIPGKSLRLVSGSSLLILLALALAAPAADWLVWHWRLARGTGTRSIAVTRMVVAPLKGNREEYYMDGTEEVQCSRSVLPQGSHSPCWWLERHRVVYDR